MNSIIFIFAVMNCSMAASDSVPDFKVQIEPPSHLILTPPSGHHINEKAPLHVQMNGEELKLLSSTPMKVTFQVNKSGVNEYVATAYLCDDANTYCIKKTVKNSTKIETLAPSKKRSSVFKGKKEGFIYNDSAAGFAEAKKKNKPLLIDFFGIWCPPCNVLDETVFNHPDFKKIAKDFILLKLDADDPASWDLKERYKVGGYPTILFADTQGEEISRILGSRRPSVFFKLMKEANQNKDKPISSIKDLAAKGDDGALYRLGEQALERAEWDLALSYLEPASKKFKQDDSRFEKLYEARIGQNKGKTKKATPGSEEFKKLRLQQKKLLEEILSKNESGFFYLNQAMDLADLQEELGEKEARKKTLEKLVAHAALLLAEPKRLEQEEADSEDILEMMATSLENLDKKEEAKKAWGEAAELYKSKIAGLGKRAESERGWNLSRAYCLNKAGKTEDAISLYAKLEKQYPKEFTFFYAHGRMLLELKKFSDATPIAEKALKVSYGDNRLRSGHLLAQALEGSGKLQKAVEVIDQTLKEVERPADPHNRTHRYFEMLEKLKAKISKT